MIDLKNTPWKAIEAEKAHIKRDLLKNNWRNEDSN